MLPNIVRNKLTAEELKEVAKLRELTKAGGRYAIVNSMYYTTRQWALLKELKFQEVNHICEQCRIKSATECHHTRYKDDNGENYNEGLEYLQALCYDCHAHKHAYKSGKKINFDPSQQNSNPLPQKGNEMSQHNGKVQPAGHNFAPVLMDLFQEEDGSFKEFFEKLYENILFASNKYGASNAFVKNRKSFRIFIKWVTKAFEDRYGSPPKGYYNNHARYVLLFGNFRRDLTESKLNLVDRTRYPDGFATKKKDDGSMPNNHIIESMDELHNLSKWDIDDKKAIDDSKDSVPEIFVHDASEVTDSQVVDDLILVRTKLCEKFSNMSSQEKEEKISVMSVEALDVILQNLK